MSELAIVENDVDTGIVPLNVEAADKRAADELELATRMSKRIIEVVDSTDLSVKFSGKAKPYLMVEAWVILSRFLGLTPNIVSVTYEERDDDGEKIYGYIAEACLLNGRGEKTSRAYGECWSSEANWSGRERFQLASMAQTRAIGKSCRISLSFVVSLAGYETTPAEEMDGIFTEPAPKTKRKKAETPPPASPPRAAPQRSSGGGSPYRQLMEYIEELGLDKNTLHRVAKEVNGSGKITDYDDEQIQQTRSALDKAAGLEAPAEDEDADALPF